MTCGSRRGALNDARVCAGFRHSAFTFANESQIAKSPMYASDVPQGSLVLYLQKGLQYVEVETHVNEVRVRVRCSS